MMRLTSLQSFLLCWLAFVLLGTQAVLAQGKEWIKLRSENFVVYTPANEGKARRVLEHLERVRRAYAYMLDTELSNEEPVYVVLFQNHRDYLAYAPSETSHGYYTQSRGRDYIVMSDVNENAERLMNHEYFHLYSRHQKIEWPTWAHEGFADYFSTLKITGKRIEVGHPIENHMRYLVNTGRSLSAADLFSMSAEERHAAGRRAVSDLYAMSWALVHMIFSAPEQQHVATMLAALQRTEDSTEAFKQVYGWSEKDVDDHLRGYVRRAVMGFKVMDVPGLDFDAPTEPAAIEPWEAPLILADLFTFTRRMEKAEEEYKRLSLVHPDAPDIDDSMGHLHLRKNERAEALPWLRSAIAKGSTNAETYSFLVYSECQSSTVSEECFDMAQKAADLAPNNKQIQLFRMNLMLRAQRYVQALLLANKVGSITPKEAPQFFYQVAYAQFRLGQIEDARTSLAKALEHTESAVDRERIEGLQEALDRGALVQTARLPESREPQLADEDFDERDLRLKRDEVITPEEFQASEESRAAQAAAQPSESVAQRQVRALVMQNVTLALATLREMECSTTPPSLKVTIEGAILPLLIDDSTRISIIRDGRLVNDYQFTCGPQAGENLRVGYEAQPGGNFLRLLQFGAIE